MITDFKRFQPGSRSLQPGIFFFGTVTNFINKKLQIGTLLIAEQIPGKKKYKKKKKIRKFKM